MIDEQGKEIRPGSEESLPLYRSRKGLSSLSGGMMKASPWCPFCAVSICEKRAIEKAYFYSW